MNNANRSLFSRPVAAVTIALAAFLMVAFVVQAATDIAAIPAGPTTWHDHDFAPFLAIALGVPLLVLYVGSLIRLARRQELAPLTVWTATLNLALAVLALGATK